MEMNEHTTYDSDIYYGYILKADLHGAIAYIKQFPEQSELYNRFVALFEHEQYIQFDVDDDLNEILALYQHYYRNVFYLGIDKDEAAELLRVAMLEHLGSANTNVPLCDLEQKQLPALFESKGLHFMSGKTSGYYGPYVWRSTEMVRYEVELPDCVQAYSVKLLDGFIMRSWIDYLSFGEIGPGGWADGDGYINCVKSAYDFESEGFRVSLLKHEAQHAKDLESDKDMSSEDLEYRAKLVELIYSKERNLLREFFYEADTSDASNGHAMAAQRIMDDFKELTGKGSFECCELPIQQIQQYARQLFDWRR